FSSGQWSFGGFFDNVLRNPHRPLPVWELCRHHICNTLTKLQTTYIPALIEVTNTFLPFQSIPSLQRSQSYAHIDFERQAHLITIAYLNTVCDVIQCGFPVYGRDPNILFIVNRELPRIRFLLQGIHHITLASACLPVSHSESHQSIRPNLESKIPSVNSRKNEMSGSSSDEKETRKYEKPIVHLEKKEWLKEKEQTIKNKKMILTKSIEESRSTNSSSPTNSYTDSSDSGSSSEGHTEFEIAKEMQSIFYKMCTIDSPIDASIWKFSPESTTIDPANIFQFHV
ncbi:hypothetical protein PFISCL1PPCAC_11254, partial [Pristionchus fissidentatus]